MFKANFNAPAPKPHKHPLYTTWQHFKTKYPSQLSPIWSQNFWAFASDIAKLGPRKPRALLERKDPNLPFQRGNVYWGASTPGDVLTQAQWAERRAHPMYLRWKGLRTQATVIKAPILPDWERGFMEFVNYVEGLRRPEGAAELVLDQPALGLVPGNLIWA